MKFRMSPISLPGMALFAGAALVIFLVGIVSGGCGGGHSVYPITSGSHVPADAFGHGLQDASGHTVPDQLQRFVVWSNHTGVEHYITGLLLQLGYTVVERARLQKILSEQNLRIAQADTSSKLSEEILAASKLVGASQVIFAEVHSQTRPAWPENARLASVEVRSVSVESGEVRWAGTAQYRELVAAADGNVVALAHWAIWRATCRVEKGYTWHEPSDSTTGGCIAKDWLKERQVQDQRLSTELQELTTEKQAIDQQKQGLDQQQAAINAAPDTVRRQKLLPEYMQRLEAYKQRVAAYDQRVQEFNRRRAELSSQKEK